jgi:hypothetical protein
MVGIELIRHVNTNTVTNAPVQKLLGLAIQLPMVHPDQALFSWARAIG